VLRIDAQEDIEHGEHIGDTTNNQAEYQALLFGMRRAHTENVGVLECFLDSELVVKQLKGQYRVKDPDLRVHYADISSLITHFENVTFTHVPRAKNKDADRLVNEALDKSGN